MRAARWFAIAGLACVAIAAAYLPPQPDRLSQQRGYPGEVRTRLSIVNSAYSRTEEMLKDLRLRDSLRTALRHSGSRLGDVVVITPTTLSAESQHQFRATVEHIWQEVHAPAGSRLLVVLRDTYRWGQPIYVLPSALDGRCAAVVTIDWNLTWLRREATRALGTNLEPWLREKLGPCLYYASFGEPGPQISAWLAERHFKVANTADWNAAPPTFVLRDDPPSFDMLISNTSFDAVACMSGQVARCQNAVERTQLDELRFRSRLTYGTGVVHRTFWPRNFPFDDHYLSGLVREMGRDRFARFWTSRSPVDSAFLAAFGQPIDQWTAHWARTWVPDMPPFGPAPRPIAIAYVIAVAAVATALAAAGVMRRQVG